MALLALLNLFILIKRNADRFNFKINPLMKIKPLYEVRGKKLNIDFTHKAYEISN